MKYSCPCCGYYTFPVPREDAIAYICPVCFWENDLFVASDDEPSDENHGMTLKEGRENFKLFGACSADMLEHVRQAKPEELVEDMYSDLLKELAIDCEKCSGLCCVALYCSKTDGFPEDKPADKPCKHLQSNFKCDIHTQLFEKNLKGCLIYECFGAGQKVTQMYASLGDWVTNPRQKKEIYEVFLIIAQLHQMRWYLIQAFNMNVSLEFNEEISVLIEENKQLANQEPCHLVKYDLSPYRERTNNLLKRITRQMSKVPKEQNKSFFGRDFKGKNLDGMDFSMALMIASNLENCSLKGTNFLGADMRDVNVKNTDLREALFLTQMQLNGAKGNADTKLPAYLSRPSGWH